LSEVQQLEFNRRIDIAYALVPFAAHFFGLRADLTAQIAAGKKRSSSPWYWVVGLAGIGLHYVFAPPDAKFSVGLWLSLMAFGYWVLTGYTTSKLEERRSACVDKLMSIATVWNGATGYAMFWDMERFVEDGSIDREDDAFFSWWTEQRDMVLVRCGAVEAERHDSN